MSTFTSRTFQQVFDDARAVGLLNDAAKDIYTDAVLLPHGAYAHGEIQEEFAAAGIPLLETVNSTLTYTANQETIAFSGLTDVEEPLELWERSTDDQIWFPMRRVTNLRPPYASPDARLYRWEWLNGVIRVLPCSQNRNLFLRYRRRLPYPAAGSTMDFEGIYWALVAGTALYAAILRPAVQEKAGAMYTRSLERAIRLASRDRQGIVFRPRPWNERVSRVNRVIVGT